MHDGGGDRSQTVLALPAIIEGIRARGYQIVPLYRIDGKTRADVMPPFASEPALGGPPDLDRVLAV